MLRYALFFLIFFSPFVANAQWQAMTLPEGPQFLGAAADQQGLVLVKSYEVWHWTPGQPAVLAGTLPWSLSNTTEFFETAGVFYLFDQIADQTRYSLNRGLSWNNLPGFVNWAPETFQAESGRLWVQDKGLSALHFTEDYGASWQTVSTLDPGTDKIVSFTVRGDTLAVLLSTQFALSTDGGTSWQYLAAPPMPNQPSISRTALLLAGGYFYVWFGGPSPQVFRSADGQNWTALSNFFSNGTLPSKPRLMEQGNNCLFASDRWQMWRSDDGGLNWNKVAAPGARYHFSRFAGELFLSCNIGLFALNAGDEWTPRNNFFHLSNDNVVNLAVAFFPVDGGLSLITAKGNYFSEDLGNSWTYKAGPVSSNIYAQQGDTIIVKYADHWRTTDGGRHWQVFTPQLDYPSESWHFFLAGDTLYTNDVYTLKRSTDLGTTYQAVPTPGNAKVWMAARAGGTIYIQLQQDNLEIWKTSNHGVNWTQVNQGLPAMNPGLSRLYSDGSRPYFCDGAHIYRLEQDNWVLVDTVFGESNFNNPPTRVFGQPNVTMVVGDYSPGLHTTTDTGAHWFNALSTVQNAGKTPTVAISPQWTFAGTFNVNQGIWQMYRRPTSDFQGLPITGRTYADLNLNQQYDPGEPAQPGVQLSISSGQAVASNSDGLFDAFGWTAGDTLRVTLLPPFTAAKPEFYVLPAEGGNFDFAVTSPVVEPDWAVYTTNVTPFKPGNTTKVFINLVQTPGTEYPSNLYVTLPSNLELLSAQPPETDFSGSVLHWDTLYNGSPGLVSVCLEVRTDSLAMFGDTVRISSWLDLDEADLSNNQDTLLALVASSFDPNDKQCMPSSLSMAQGENGAELRYLIRFQNTGTAPAGIVRLLDTLPPEILPATFHFESASHPVTWLLKPGGVAEFLFAGINLPDSASNEPASHGFVRFSVQSRTGLVPGNKISNTASIYFDGNDPVQTNTCVTPVQQSNGVKEQAEIARPQLLAMPNPATNTVVLSLFDEPFINADVSIYEPSKNQCVQRWDHFNGERLECSVAQWPAGTYTVLIFSRGVWNMEEFVVVH